MKLDSISAAASKPVNALGGRGCSDFETEPLKLDKKTVNTAVSAAVDRALGIAGAALEVEVLSADADKSSALIRTSKR